MADRRVRPGRVPCSLFPVLLGAVSVLVVLHLGEVIRLPVVPCPRSTGHRVVLIGLSLGATVAGVWFCHRWAGSSDRTVLLVAALVGTAATTALVGNVTRHAWAGAREREAPARVAPVLTASDSPARMRRWNGASPSPSSRGPRLSPPTVSPPAPSPPRSGSTPGPAPGSPDPVVWGPPTLADALTGEHPEWTDVDPADPGGGCRLDSVGLWVSVGSAGSHMCRRDLGLLVTAVEVEFLLPTAHALGIALLPSGPGEAHLVTADRAGAVVLGRGAPLPGDAACPAGSWHPGPVRQGQWHVLAVTLGEGLVSVYLDHRLVGEVVGPRPAAGRIGLFAVGGCASPSGAELSGEGVFRDLRAWS